MYKASAGFHRLGILVGSLATLCWLIYVVIESNGLSEVQPKGWVMIPLMSIAIFLLGYGAIIGIHWVKAGFQNDQPKS